jgi:hypothetical protein
LQTGIDARTRRRRQDEPGFGLAAFARRDQCGLVVARMHLDRQHLLHVEKFQQQRKAAEPLRQIPQDRCRRARDQLRDRAPLQRPIGDTAWILGAVAQQPGFADRPVAGQPGARPFGKAATAPKAVLKDRLEAERIQRRIGRIFHATRVVAARWPARSASESTHDNAMPFGCPQPQPGRKGRPDRP